MNLPYNENELNGISLLKQKTNTQQNSIYTFIRNTLEAGEIWKGELQFNHKDRHIIWLDATIKPLTSDTLTQGYIATFIDISNRKQLIDNLKQRAHRQSLIAILGQISLNNIPINDLLEQTLSVVCGSLSMDMGIILETIESNQSATIRASYNFSDSEHSDITINDNNILDFTLQSNQPVTSRKLRNDNRFNTPDIFLQGHIHSGTSIIIGDKKNSFGILILLSSKEKSSETEEIHFLQSVCNILAEAINRKNMEQALRHERKLLKNYLNVAEVIFIILDIKGNITLANRHAALVLGYSQDELAGLNFINTFIPENLKPGVRNNFQKMLHQEEIPENLIQASGNTTPVINKKQETRYIRWKSSALLDDNNEVCAMLSAGEDITETLKYEEQQKTLEKQLHQAQKTEAVGRLAGGIAHDFNNILASILGFCELAFEDLNKDKTKTYAHLIEIQKAGIKARDIIARMQSINLQDDMPNKAILLPSLLKNTLHMLRSALPSSINIQLNMGHHIPAIHINASKFNQMIMHLLINARNQLKGQGEIKIDLNLTPLSNKKCQACHKEINAEYVTLNFYFSGPSINDECKPEVIEHSHTPASGLSLVSSLLHENSGHILITSITSDNISADQSCCIQLLFEIATENQQENKLVDKHTQLTDIKSKNIMIIDNENSVATYMGELFRGGGFKTSIFCDSVEAMNAFIDMPDSYNLIICSNSMPVLSGILLVDKIMQLKPGIPAIICMDKASSNETTTNINTDKRHFLNKPVNSAELLNSVMSLLIKK